MAELVSGDTCVTPPPPKEVLDRNLGAWDYEPGKVPAVESGPLGSAQLWLCACVACATECVRLCVQL